MKFFIFLFGLFGLNDSCQNLGNRNQNNQLSAKNEIDTMKQKDSLLIRKLDSKLKNYIAKNVSELLSDSTIQYTYFAFFDEPPGVLSYLLLQYSDQIYVKVFVKNYQYVKPFSKDLNWSLEDFQKEKIGMMKLISNNKVISEFR